MPALRRRRRLAVLISVLVLLLAIAGPVSARSSKGQQLSADLDGVPIELAEVADWYCHDFDYPVIHCFSDPARLEVASRSALETSREASIASGDLAAALTGTAYVTIYEFPSYQGAFIQLSADYPALTAIGWNDRISSFKARNGLSGTFFVDWFYASSQWSFCCNQEVPSLNAYDNLFSSVKRI